MTVGRARGRTAVVACALALIALALPAVAGAELYRGQTDQGRMISVRTGADDRPLKVRVRWFTLGCEDPDASYSGLATFRRPFDVATKTEFADRRVQHFSQDDDIRINVFARVRGTLTSDTWTGVFRATAVIRRHGRFLDRCTFGPVDWSATLVL